MEHRWGARVLVCIPVRIRCRNGNFVDAHLVDISISGALIRTAMALTRFAPLEIELKGCTVPAFVVRVLSDGIGAEWSGRLPHILENALLEQPMTSNMAPASVIIDGAVV
jgi:hypothetical protein